MKSLKELKGKYEKMGTRQLLALYKEIKNDLSYCDMYEDSFEEEMKKEISIMKKELDTREHVPNKAEAKKIRQEKARKK